MLTSTKRHKSVCSSFINNSLKMEIAPMSIREKQKNKLWDIDTMKFYSQ